MGDEFEIELGQRLVIVGGVDLSNRVTSAELTVSATAFPSLRLQFDEPLIYYSGQAELVYPSLRGTRVLLDGEFVGTVSDIAIIAAELGGLRTITTAKSATVNVERGETVLLLRGPDSRSGSPGRLQVDPRGP